MARAIAAITRITAWQPCMTGHCDRRMKTRDIARACAGLPGNLCQAKKNWRRGYGIEPSYTALQAVASPLCHPAADAASVRRYVLRAAV